MKLNWNNFLTCIQESGSRFLLFIRDSNSVKYIRTTKTNAGTRKLWYGLPRMSILLCLERRSELILISKNVSLLLEVSLLIFSQQKRELAGRSLLKINGSVPAPRFNIVERHNDWPKAIKASERLSDTKKTNLEYWEAFKKYAFNNAEFKKKFSERKAYPQGWYDLSVGNRHCHITLTATMTKNVLQLRYISVKIRICIIIF